MFEDNEILPIVDGARASSNECRQQATFDAPIALENFFIYFAFRSLKPSAVVLNGEVCERKPIAPIELG